MRGVDLETVPNQLGTAVLRLADGALLHRTGQMDSPEGAEAARALYQILLDAGVILRGHKDDALRRIAGQWGCGWVGSVSVQDRL